MALFDTRLGSLTGSQSVATRLDVQGLSRTLLKITIVPGTIGTDAAVESANRPFRPARNR